MTDPGRSGDAASADGSAAPASSAVDQLMDLGIFAPLGFVLECRTLVPELAATGRRQVAFSRSLGRAALRAVGVALDQRQASSEKQPAHDATDAPHDAVAAVAGYDSLSARDIIAMAPQASPDEVAWMVIHEEQGKARVTVLRALRAVESRDRS